MKNLVKTINQYFINVLLIIFYLTILGLSFLIMVVTKHLKRTNTNPNSFWEISNIKQKDDNYFLSPY